jgi:phosphoadenosine phosphosulfate reductase
MREMADTAPQRAAALTARYTGHEGGEDLLRPLIEQEFRGSIALLSSFGSEAALLLGMVASIDRTVPVIFLDTGKLFGETLRYRDRLVRLLGLTDLRIVRPDPVRVATQDPQGALWHDDPDACCALRKVAPLAPALAGFNAWISGRKRYQGGLRRSLELFEAADGRVKINPLAGWSRSRIEAALADRGLPPHPLEADGFLSIGCMPCTQRVAPGADHRSGRWAGLGKTECGIHL